MKRAMSKTFPNSRMTNGEFHMAIEKQIRVYEKSNDRQLLG